MRIVCVSDTHLTRPPVPDGDVLVHAGDLTLKGNFLEIVSACSWIASLPHKHKIVIAGNHDGLFQKHPVDAKVALGEGITYLEDSGVRVEGLSFWGSPWTPRFYDWSFQLERKRPEGERPFLLAQDMKQPYRFAGDHWSKIPRKTDVLITHGPPMGILDETHHNAHVGDEWLLQAVGKVRPRLHVFGHIHSNPGRVELDGTIYVNASMCDESYRPTRQPFVVDL